MKYRCVASQCAVILVNFCNASDTIACLRALSMLQEEPGMVIVVDNNSHDDSLSDILQAWSAFADPLLVPADTSNVSVPPGARNILLARATNDGFAGGNNAGIRLAFQNSACQAVWLLNNDAIPEPNALQALCQRMSSEKILGIVGSTLVYGQDKSTVQALAGSTLNRVLGTTAAIGGGHTLQEAINVSQHDVEQRLDYINGASMLLQREVVETIGLFDEKFFLYYEETEYCIRAHKAGYALAWAPESIVYHKEGGSTGAVSKGRNRAFSRPAWVDYLGLRNRVYMMRKHYPWFLPLVVLSYVGVMLNRIRRGQTERIALVCRALWDGICVHMGRPNALLPPEPPRKGTGSP